MDLSCTLYHTCLYEENGCDVYPDTLNLSVYITAHKDILTNDERVTTASPNNDLIFSPKERLLTNIDLNSIDEISCQAFPDYVDLTYQHNSFHVDRYCDHPILPTHFEQISQSNYKQKISSTIGDFQNGLGKLIHECKLLNLQLVTECWGPMQYRFDLHLLFNDKSERDIVKIFTLYRS